MRADELDGSAKELDPHRRGVATLPGHLHDRNAHMGLDHLTDIYVSIMSSAIRKLLPR
jgi:hypothetical protein